jgi:hypothetical protein
MVGGGLAGEYSIADQTFAPVLIEHEEHLADAIGTRGCLDVIVS